MGATRSIRDKKKGRTREPFVMVPCKWMDLPAWAHLNGNAVKLLLHLIRLSGGDNGAGSERGELFLSERGAAKAIGVARNTASVAFDQLIEAGWLRPVQKGHFAVKAGEQDLRASVWRLTCQPYPQARSGPSGEFLRWEPQENPRAQKLNDTGAKIEPVPPFEVETGAEIEPVAEPLPSEGENVGWPIFEPHLDIAIGERSGTSAENSKRSPLIQNDPPPPPSIRALVAPYYQAMSPAGREALAKRVGVSAAELKAFAEGREGLPIVKQMALRAQARTAA